MELQRPNFTNFDGIGERPFLGDLISTFLGGQGDLFSEATSLFQIGGSAFPERWFLCQQNHLSGNLDSQTDDHNLCSAHQKCCAALFQRGGSCAGRTTSLEIWTARDPLREKKQLFQGVKPKKSCPTFFCGSVIHIKNTFCKKNRSKHPFEPSVVVRAIYRRLYGGATAN